SLAPRVARRRDHRGGPRPQSRSARRSSTRQGTRGRRPKPGAESLGMIVLGIDPGLASTGYGIVARREGRLVALDGGVIETPAELARERRLAEIHAELEQLIGAYEPDAVALEELYFGQNVRT